MTENVRKKPSREKFVEFCAKRLHVTREDITEAIWEKCESVKWLKKNGEEPLNWRHLAAIYGNAVLEKLGLPTSGKYKRERISKNILLDQEPYSGEMHYSCYANGNCDICSHTRAGASSYVTLNNNREVVKSNSRGFLHTTHNRMELLAIISAVNSCPFNAQVDVYTDSQYCILVLSKDTKPKKNADLYELYKKCAAHVEGVRFHWIKKRNSSIYQKWANGMTYTAYCAICDAYNIEKTPKIKP